VIELAAGVVGPDADQVAREVERLYGVRPALLPGGGKRTLGSTAGSSLVSSNPYVVSAHAYARDDTGNASVSNLQIAAMGVGFMRIGVIEENLGLLAMKCATCAASNVMTFVNKPE
jgi:hypothetical protein